MNYLKKVREEKGLSQKELAERCGVIRQTISNIENGVTNPSVNLAKKMAEVLGVDWVNFFGS